MKKLPIYGLMAEFADPNTLVAAARKTREAGYRKMDAFSPFPIEELSDALGHRHDPLPLLVLIGGIAGGASGFLFQYWASAIDYPINVGGRPLLSWPSFIPVTFEMTILVAAFVAVLGMLGLNELPMPYHPVFNIPRFSLASREKFFLLIEAIDPKYDYDQTREFMGTLGAQEVFDVPE